jgi:FMN reductase
MTHERSAAVDLRASAKREPVTPTRIRVVGVGGSLAAPSASLAALRVALEGAATAEADVELLDLRALDLPMFLPTATPPDAAVRFCDAVYAAHGLLWSSPMYNGTVSGAFKNAIDWLHLLGDRKPPYLTNKVVGLISTAGGIHGLQAVNTMEFIARSLRAWAVPLVLPIARAPEVFGAEGVRDPLVASQLRSLGHEVARAARQMTQHGYCDWMDDQSAERAGRHGAARISASQHPPSD